nr:metalloregulator ArsR/SmtB family transcription factor [Candidatus Symbiopectobacterium sp. 'North America']
MSRHAMLSLHETTILSETFRLMGDPTRLRILHFCLTGPHAVGDIAQNLAFSPSLVSHHLRLLRGARLVKRERRSRQIFYTVADHHVTTMLLDMVNHIRESQEEE